jgi:hypothetical protein
LAKADDVVSAVTTIKKELKEDKKEKEETSPKTLAKKTKTKKN